LRKKRSWKKNQKKSRRMKKRKNKSGKEIQT